MLLRRVAAIAVTAVALATVLSGTEAAARTPIAPVPPGTLAPASDGSICWYGACYDYVNGRQRVDAGGASVVMYQARPELDPADGDAHSLQELAVQSADGTQIV